MANNGCSREHVAVWYQQIQPLIPDYIFEGDTQNLLLLLHKLYHMLFRIFRILLAGGGVGKQSIWKARRWATEVATEFEEESLNNLKRNDSYGPKKLWHDESEKK